MNRLPKGIARYVDRQRNVGLSKDREVYDNGAVVVVRSQEN
jgi:hypothetical protein